MKKYNYTPIPLYHNVQWNLTSESCHILLLSPTGGGKSYLTAYLLAMAVKRGHTVYFVDAKNSDFGAIVKKAGIKVASTPEEIIDLLKFMVNKMESTYSEHYENRTIDFGANFSSLNLPAHILIFDEVLAGLHAGDKKQKQEMENLLKQIALKGRMAGFIICLTSQYLLSTDLPQSINSQCQTRIVLGSEVSEELFNIATRHYKKDLGTAYKGGVGRGYAVTPQTGLTYFEAPKMTLKGYDYTGLLKKLKGDKHD